MVNTRLLGVNLLIFAGIFTLSFVIYVLIFNSFISELHMALIILGIMLICIAAVLVINGGNVMKNIETKPVKAKRTSRRK